MRLRSRELNPWVIVAAVAAAGVMGLAVLFVILEGQDRNRQGIQVSCVLLANAIVESGAGGGRQSSPQQQLNALYIRVLLRAATPEELKKAAALQAKIAEAGPQVTYPNCEQVAEHPESVKAIPLGDQ